ncbi:hypothetical protein [Sphingobacterium faecium]|uniref:hypothetical protein n=1 Tax=Sphingobacterium faecium TaxID=34087 RepID=UPI0024684207|nr:hypothetical protein [Sphingobacterium faecium]MDH5826265.1 hypothetical protein [Sphingobacterium faecium]
MTIKILKYELLLRDEQDVRRLKYLFELSTEEGTVGKSTINIIVSGSLLSTWMPYLSNLQDETELASLVLHISEPDIRNSVNSKSFSIDQQVVLKYWTDNAPLINIDNWVLSDPNDYKINL